MNGAMPRTDISSTYLLFVLLFSDSPYADRISLEELISYGSVGAMLKIILLQDGSASFSKFLWRHATRQYRVKHCKKSGLKESTTNWNNQEKKAHGYNIQYQYLLTTNYEKNIIRQRVKHASISVLFRVVVKHSKQEVHFYFKRQNHLVNSIFVGGLSLHFRVFRGHWGDKVTDSALDEDFFYVSYSNKTWVFDLSERAQGLIYILKHNFDVRHNPWAWS